MEEAKQAASCGYKCGPLPACAPLAAGTLPNQNGSAPRYEAARALTRGTLFPGLDLPLGNVVNTGTADVPLSELMALDFAAHDLNLYLDTHPDDREAFAVYKDLLRLAREGRERYVRQYGPITASDMADMPAYNWTGGPWPWECRCEREG